MKRPAVIAVVFAIDAHEDDPQVNSFERFQRDLPECPNARILFASGVLAATPNEVGDPDFDVTVRAHGRVLEQFPFEGM
jgi:hypothetical protein